MLSERRGQHGQHGQQRGRRPRSQGDLQHRLRSFVSARVRVQQRVATQDRRWRAVSIRCAKTLDHSVVSARLRDGGRARTTIVLGADVNSFARSRCNNDNRVSYRCLALDHRSGIHASERSEPHAVALRRRPDLQAARPHRRALRAQPEGPVQGARRRSGTQQRQRRGVSVRGFHRQTGGAPAVQPPNLHERRGDLEDDPGRAVHV